jgi:hypothetical protein
MRWRILLILLGSMLMAIMGNLIAIFHGLVGVPAGAWQVALANDRALNGAIGGSGAETVSSHAARARSEGRLWGCILCNGLLDRVQPNHCKESEGE